MVIDPLLGDVLRPHQKVGVQFLYDCVMGRRKGNDGAGCILADEMGLGKTLTTVTLVWTLLKQGPRGVPIARKVIIITRVSCHYIMSLLLVLSYSSTSSHPVHSIPFPLFRGKAKYDHL